MVESSDTIDCIRSKIQDRGCTLSTQYVFRAELERQRPAFNHSPSQAYDVTVLVERPHGSKAERVSFQGIRFQHEQVFFENIAKKLVERGAFPTSRTRTRHSDRPQPMTAGHPMPLGLKSGPPEHDILVSNGPSGCVSGVWQINV